MKAFINIVLLVVIAYVIYYFYSTDVSNAVPLTPEQLAKNTIDTVKNAFSSITGKIATPTAPAPIIKDRIVYVTPPPPKPLTKQQQFDQELASAIKQVDKVVYDRIGWGQYSDAAFNAERSKEPPYKFGNIENQWEVTKWRIANFDGNTTPLPVPARFTNYGYKNTGGKYYLPNFGTNYLYAESNDEKAAVLSGFLSSFYYHLGYRSQSDLMAAIGFVKLAASLL